jgi:2-oxoglutarate ferredoxin oxidoreductase subunit beta
MTSKNNLIKNKDFRWCSGCGLYSLFNHIIQSIPKNTVIVSGIGCTGRITQHFNLDSVHTPHGRAIPVAVGIKRANPKLNVIVISGDGDIQGIGGNHLIHAARRNEDITVICNNNQVLAMTGGQLAPSTKKQIITKTSAHGNPYAPLNTKAIITSNPHYFYATTTHMHKDHSINVIKEGIKHKGFSYIENLSPCLIHYGKKNKLTTSSDINNKIKTMRVEKEWK